ncbi:MAG: cation transporter [Alicyclobacillus macrosporangiidus]|uniref:cation diffusion facilitator family transporter n=1 Tax=Alicyclobacillus macrosporangiidus TaxID=392015 RepID=UPI0026F024F2|nr:cation transporter [Alicyclobacillus macrosporangiidus]MCL6598208.1 cation transporter [Alicyclobacillus macrosporangiidus]
MAQQAEARRISWLVLALWVETASLLWILAEAALSGFAAMRAGSLALSAFSADSGIEFVSGVILWVRLWWEQSHPDHGWVDRVERVSSALVAGCLFSLAGFISFQAGQALAMRSGMLESPLGLVVAVASSLVTPWLALVKRRLGRKLHSHALLGDAACSMTCACMAWALLAGLVLQWAFGWWWVDAAAALGIVAFVLREAWESAEAAWSGAPHLHHQPPDSASEPPSASS